MQIYQFNDYECLIELIPEDSKIENLLRFRAYTTKIGGENFANVQYLENGAEILFNFYKYELIGDNVLKVNTIKTSYYKDPLFSSSKKSSTFLNSLYTEAKRT